MTADILRFNGITRLPLDPKQVLARALDDGDLKSVIIVGYTQDGEFWFASSDPDGPSVLWDLEKAKQALLNISMDQAE